MQLLGLAQKGSLKPYVHLVVPLEDSKEAFRSLAERYAKAPPLNTATTERGS
jgi:hypothetical protein